MANSVTFKVIKGRGCLFPVGRRGSPLPLTATIGRLFQWNGLYEVTARVSRKWGMYRVTQTDPASGSSVAVWRELWGGDHWAYFNSLCIPALAKLPIGVPFNVHTEWLRTATEAEMAKWC